MAVIETRDLRRGRVPALCDPQGRRQEDRVQGLRHRSCKADGIIALKIREGDELIGVRLTDGDDHVLMVSRNGQAVRFSEHDVRAMGRDASGVAGMKLRAGDEVIAVEIARDDQDLLVVTENGFGKRTRIEEYPTKGRGTMGVLTIRYTEARGRLAGAMIVRDGYEVMLISPRRHDHPHRGRRHLAHGPAHAGRAADEPARRRHRLVDRPGVRAAARGVADAEVADAETDADVEADVPADGEESAPE